jgi:hypothetical protein
MHGTTMKMLTNLCKNPNYKILWKSVQWELNCTTKLSLLTTALRMFLQMGMEHIKHTVVRSEPKRGDLSRMMLQQTNWH